MNNTWDMVAAQLHFLPRGQFVRVEKRVAAHGSEPGVHCGRWTPVRSCHQEDGRHLCSGRGGVRVTREVT